MRIRLLPALALSSALALPALAFPVTTSGTSHSHLRRAHLRRAAATPCGRVAGHGGHTVLARPSAVPCHAAAVRHETARRTAVYRPAYGARRGEMTAHLERASLTPTEETRRTRIHTATVTRIRWVPPLRGSLASLMRQNERDEAEGLVRIEDQAQLDEMESAGDLVEVPASYSLRVNPDLPQDRRYCRPWTARFLADVAASHYARFHRPLQVNSAVRTVAFQRELLMVNGNAAPADGDIASPHLTGAAVDIGKHGLTLQEIAWMRAWLLPLETAGKIDVEEEFYQSCFHITVYRSYARPAAPRALARRRSTTTLLAAGVQ